MTYTALKTLHILSMVLLFGTGLGSAFYKWMADRSGHVAHIAVTNRHVVLADWLFTTPTVLFQLLSGVWMLHLAGVPLDTLWVILSLGLYAVAGGCWLPVVWLQIRMQRIAEEAAAGGGAAPAPRSGRGGAGGGGGPPPPRPRRPPPAGPRPPPPPGLYWRMARAWFWLGVPAFVAMVLVVVLMVFKHIPGVAT